MSLAVLETYRGTGDLRVTNSTSGTYAEHTFEVEYPFADIDFTFQPDSARVLGSGKYRSDARFYVAVSVFTFLYVVVVTLCYAFLEGRLKEAWRKYFYHTVRTLR